MTATPWEREAPQNLRGCKHCGQTIASTDGLHWTHAVGLVQDLSRCHPTQSGLVYGYNADPIGSECTYPCPGLPSRHRRTDSGGSVHEEEAVSSETVVCQIAEHPGTAHHHVMGADLQPIAYSCSQWSDSAGGCMCTSTSVTRGHFRDESETRAEWFSLLARQG